MSGEHETEETVPPRNEEEPQQRPTRRFTAGAWLFTSGILIGLFGGYSIAADSIPPAPPPGAVTETEKPTDTTIPGNGTFWIGVDAPAGLYRSLDNGIGCRWSRSRDASGETRSIIASDTSPGDTYVDLRENEFFDTAGCSTWRRVEDHN